MIHIIDLKKEKWKKIILDDDISNYEISNYGRVKNSISGKILKQSVDKDGYFKISIFVKNKRKYIGVHRLVGIMFLDCPTKYKELQINHKNGKKYCNKPYNLEWCTNKENIKHSRKNHLQQTKFKEVEVEEVCELLEKGMKRKEVFDNITFKKYTDKKSIYELINRIKQKQAWTDISCKYKINKNKAVKYNNNTVKSACELLQKGYSYKKIAQILNIEYDKSFSVFIGRLRNKKVWKKISKNYTFPESNYPTRKYDREFIENICICLQDGMSDCHDICEKLNVEYTDTLKYLIKSIKNGYSNKNISKNYNF